MSFDIHIPSDDSIRGFNLEKLEEEVEQHKKNIQTYQKILAQEELRLTVAQNVVIKKKQFMEEEKGK